SCEVVIGSELQSFEMFERIDFTLGVNSLWRPRHRKQKNQSFLRELVFEIRPLRSIKFACTFVAGCQERNRVDAVDWRLVCGERNQDLSRRRLAIADSALDLCVLDHRTARVDSDLQ